MKSTAFTLLVLLLACGPPDHSAMQAVLMERRLDERLAKFIQDEKEKCRRELLAEASTMADSILRVSNPILIQIDSIQRPPKPIRPNQPNFSGPPDSVTIAPIVPNKVLDKQK